MARRRTGAAGPGFFKKALALERKYGQGRSVVNNLQTNGTPITDEWAAFLAKERFLVGLSLDGPEALHNRYRKDASGQGSFAGAMNAARLFRKHGVRFNLLTTVNAANQWHGREVYAFLREQAEEMQFLPVVECLPAQYEAEDGQRFAMPAGRYSPALRHPVTDFSVAREGYGRFLCDVLDAWAARGDPGKKQIQQINVALANLEGLHGGLCAHEAVCGHAAAVETNGDVFRCDRYAYPAYRLGNLLETPLEALMEQNRDFGMHKTCDLPTECLTCQHIRLCFGGCPKDRIDFSPDGRQNRNYLCESYRRFFTRVKRFSALANAKGNRYNTGVE